MDLHSISWQGIQDVGVVYPGERILFVIEGGLFFHAV